MNTPAALGIHLYDEFDKLDVLGREIGVAFRQSLHHAAPCVLWFIQKALEISRIVVRAALVGREVDVERLDKRMRFLADILVRQYVVDVDRANSIVHRIARRVFSDQILQRVLVQRVPTKHATPVGAQRICSETRKVGRVYADRIGGGGEAPPPGLPQRVGVFEALEIVEVGNTLQLISLKVLAQFFEIPP